jgi:Acetyltransferase (GNAT) domain
MPAAEAVGPGRAQARVLRTLEEIECLRGTWTALQWHPNAELDFYSLILRARAEVLRPYVIVVSRNSKPVTLVAGRVEENRLEIKIGYKVVWRPKARRITVIYGGWMGEASEEVNDVVVNQLLRSLGEEGADLVSWSGLRWKSHLQELLGRRAGWLCRDYLARANEHWTMNLPATLEEFLEKRMNKKHRYWAKRTMRLLEKDFPGAVHYASLSKPDEMERLFADTVKVARATYQWGLGVGFQDNEEIRQRLRLGAEKGWLRGYLLYLKEQPVAFWLCTLCGDTVHLDFTGYDPSLRKYEVGTALFLRLIGELGKEGVELLDFGLGSALYKERFGDAEFRETTLCVFRPSLRGRGLNALRLATQGPPEVVRGLLLRAGLEQKVKRFWRTLVTPGNVKKEASPAKP